MPHKGLCLEIVDHQDSGEAPLYCLATLNESFLSQITTMRDVCEQHKIMECRRHYEVDLNPRETDPSPCILVVTAADFSIIFPEYPAETRPMKVAHLLAMIANAADKEEFLFYGEDNGAMAVARKDIEEYQSQNAPSRPKKAPGTSFAPGGDH